MHELLHTVASHSVCYCGHSNTLNSPSGGEKKKKNLPNNSHSPPLPFRLCFHLYTSSLASPTSLPLYAVSFGVAPLSAALPENLLCRHRGSIPIPHIAVAWASFTDPVDWQCECPGLMFHPAPKNFPPINHGRKITCHS